MLLQYIYHVISIVISRDLDGFELQIFSASEVAGCCMGRSPGVQILWSCHCLLTGCHQFVHDLFCITGALQARNRAYSQRPSDLVNNICVLGSMLTAFLYDLTARDVDIRVPIPFACKFPSTTMASALLVKPSSHWRACS